MEETRFLLEIASSYSKSPIADYSGIIRVVQTEEQQRQLIQHAKDFSDVSQLKEDQFLIHSGITVQTGTYLSALWSACEDLGAVFEQREIACPSEIIGFDAIVIAAGAGIFGFKELEGFRLSPVRGQSITARRPKGLHLPEKSIVGKGYLAKGEKDEEVSLGATYERGIKNEEPDPDFAIESLLPKVQALCPGFTIDPIEVKAGVRVASVGHYFPVIGNVEGPLWVMTGLGSRGLLYHGLFAKMLAKAILEGDESHFPAITQLLLSKNKSLSYTYCKQRQK
jgi:glycine/D-amino acid oxidase-like deaminating enzyme